MAAPSLPDDVVELAEVAKKKWSTFELMAVLAEVQFQCRVLASIHVRRLHAEEIPVSYSGGG